ncbi:MAG: sugar phosphate nucleotidyltransferase [Acidobacteriota bacterium]
MQLEKQVPSVDGSASRSHRWGVILAGGDGKRLLPLTRRIMGDDRPKQFSSLMGRETLLQQTQCRVSRLLKRWQTLLVLTQTHEQFYADHVADMPSGSLVVQPQNQGTAPAILYSLMRVREMDPNGSVAFFPSDHYFSDDDAFRAHADSAFVAAESRPDLVFLLGITPDSPEAEYGWIEPGAPLEGSASDSIRRISGFWEKPSSELACSLMERGCLWNSFVMVGRVQTFLGLINRALPQLLSSFEAVRALLFTRAEQETLRNLYSGLSDINFSRHVLAAQTRGNIL